jgi:hypothetical protein
MKEEDTASHSHSHSSSNNNNNSSSMSDSNEPNNRNDDRGKSEKRDTTAANSNNNHNHSTPSGNNLKTAKISFNALANSNNGRPLTSVFGLKDSKPIMTIKSTKKRKASALEEIMQEQEERKLKQAKGGSQSQYRQDNWITDGIVVKVMDKKLADGKYYKQKGVIQDVIDKFTAQIKMLESGHVLKVDQSDLETVIPALDHEVVVVNGPYRSETATLLKLDERSFSVTIRLETGPSKGKTVDRIPLEEVCKIHTA